jgi:alpha-ribazole phosphatase
MGKIILIRHGEVTWNRQACYTGWTDLALTEKGVAQAQSVAQRLASEPLEAVYSSDLQRARLTAEIIAAPHGLAPVVNADLRELNYGEWEGIAEVDLPVQYPELYAEWAANPAETSIPSGETFSQLLQRMSKAMSFIMDDHPDGTVAVVAHKSANRVILCHWLGVDINLYKRIEQDNAALNTAIFTPDRVQIETINDTCHLKSS